MGISRVIYYWLLLALLAQVIRSANAVVPPVQSTLPVMDTFPLAYATVHMLKHKSHLDDYSCSLTQEFCMYVAHCLVVCVSLAYDTMHMMSWHMHCK